MPRPVRTDPILKVVLSLLLALLAWQGKQLCERVGALERNQIKIMVELGIPPVASDTLDLQGKNTLFAGSPTINEIKPVAAYPEIEGFFP